MTDQDIIDRGRRAAGLLSDPILSEAFDAVRGAIVKRWESAPLRDKDGAHELKLMLKLLSDVRANLEQAVNDGKVTAFRHQEKRRFPFLG